MSNYTRPDVLDVLSWNVKAGGYDKYDSNQTTPEREGQIKDIVTSFHNKNQGSSAVTITDAHRWDNQYGGDAGIAAHLGYPYARFVLLDDDSLRKRGIDGIGTAFATDRRIEASEALDLDTRRGLKVILDVGEYGLQIANVYLDDLSEDIRMRQIRALSAGLEPDVPTLLLGDFNALRPMDKDSSIGVRTGDLVVRSLALLLPKRSELGKSVKGRNERRVIPFIESLGYIDADKDKKRPTAPALLPIFGVDYGFSKGDVDIKSFEVLPAHGASDHRPVTFSAETR